MSQNDLSQFDPEFIEEKHPRHRAVEEDDPMQLNADAVYGDPEVMLESLIEEYARMGQSAGQIAEIFSLPFFQATYGLNRHFGEQSIHERIDAVLQRSGVFRFTTVEARREPELVQITVNRPNSITKGD